MIAIRLVAEAVALGLSGDPAIFGEMLAGEWIRLRKSRASGGGR